MQQPSALKKKREIFSRQIRKGQIQKIQKEKRQKQMRFVNPLWYISKLKEELATKDPSLNQIKDYLQFLEENIKDDKFSSIIEEENIVESVLVVLTQALDPWMGEQQKIKRGITIPHNKPLQQVKLFMCGKCKSICQCMDLSDCPTEVCQSFSKSPNQDVEIDGPSFSKEHQLIEAIKNTSLNQTQQHWLVVFYKLIDFLETTFLFYLNTNHKTADSQPYCTDPSKLIKFKRLFLNVVDIVENFVLDLVCFQKQRNSDRNMQNALKIMVQQPQRMHLILKIMSFLSKVGKVSYLGKLHWPILLQLYCQFMNSQRSQVKHMCQKVKEIKEMFAVLGKSMDKNEIFDDSRYGDKISNLLYPWVSFVKETLQNQSSESSLNKHTLQKIFQNEFGLLMSIMTKTKYLEKYLNQEIKQILGQLLSISKLLEQTHPTSKGQIQFTFISPKTIQSQESFILKECKHYCQKLIKLLYEQMEFDQSDLHRICEVQPALKQKIQQIIDADQY